MTEAPRIEDGYLHVPDGPGWGAELNDEAIAAHPVSTKPDRSHDRGMG